MKAASRSRRLHRWSVGVVAMVVVTLLAPAGAAQAFARAPGDAPVPPETVLSPKGVGAVTASDRDLVVKVRLAGLWEIPAGNMAQKQSDNERVREIGRMISEQHVKLDELCREAAAKLGIPLPDAPNADQILWLNEMKAASGADFDRIYIERLRSAHGKIFPAIASIRAGTRSDVVRRLAQQANQFVLTHLTLLESSEMVDYGSLPAAPQPVAAGAAPTVDEQMLAAARVPGVNTSVILIVLAAALIAGVVSTMRIFRTR